MPQRKKVAPGNDEAKRQAEREQLEQEAAELRKEADELKLKAEEITERLDTIKARLREIFPDKGTYPTATGPVQIQENNSFDPVLAEVVIGNYNKDVLKACYETKLSGKKAKELLPPALYKQCLRSNTNKVVLP